MHIHEISFQTTKSQMLLFQAIPYSFELVTNEYHWIVNFQIQGSSAINYQLNTLKDFQ